MMFERLFSVLHRVNAIGIFLFLLVFLFFAGRELLSSYQSPQDGGYQSDGSGFGADFEPTNPIIGQSVETSSGEIVAYYERDDELDERKDLAGLVLVDPKTGKSIQVAASGDTYLVEFEFLYDEGKESEPAIGYLAKVASQNDYKMGRADLIIGALPAMTKNVVARGIQYSDLPEVRSDGVLGIILWQTENEAEVVGFRLSDGSVVDRAKIDLPVMLGNRVSQGPGLVDDPELARKGPMGFTFNNEFGFWE